MCRPFLLGAEFLFVRRLRTCEVEGVLLLRPILGSRLRHFLPARVPPRHLHPLPKPAPILTARDPIASNSSIHHFDGVDELVPGNGHEPDVRARALHGRHARKAFPQQFPDDSHAVCLDRTVRFLLAREFPDERHLTLVPVDAADPEPCLVLFHDDLCVWTS